MSATPLVRAEMYLEYKAQKCCTTGHAELQTIPSCETTFIVWNNTIPLSYSMWFIGEKLWKPNGDHVKGDSTRREMNRLCVTIKSGLEHTG